MYHRMKYRMIKFLQPPCYRENEDSLTFVTGMQTLRSTSATVRSALVRHAIGQRLASRRTPSRVTD